MEESAQRRERLKAMRMEASQEATNNDVGAHSAVHLSNPLIESTVNTESQAPSSAQSFNYYTNPMAAYSGNNQRGSKVSPQISQDFSSTPTRPWSNETFPSPSLQPHINHSLNPQMQQPHGQYTNTSHYTPNAPPGGSFPNPNHNFHGRGWNTNSSRPGGYHGPGNFGYPGSQPHFTSGPGQGGYPSPGPGSSSSPHPYHGSGRGYPSPRPHFRNNANYSSNQGGYPGSGSNQGRGQWAGKSMSSGTSYGRGGGGQGQGGGGGGHNHASAEERPHMFYNKSMVEDPWKFLEPVIWKSYKKQWFPHSAGAKKPRVSESPRQQQQPTSQPSLAEILAASFNEAANDEPSAG